MRYFLIQYTALFPNGVSLNQNLGYRSYSFPSASQVEMDATTELSDFTEYRFAVSFIFEFKSEDDFNSFFSGEQINSIIKTILN